ncbi:energy-coupling factor ABC transporter substrate-binding protein [Clostridium sp. CCUG 7971]|uniref:energy-coupling factor ABC transporter substrate-binding protein n=1 Tax=Clostridium sp. CCUG 7971 TaxID=2811414 RepID=UPI001ABB40F4|nr:energy-coupling factor ABC transporter substrate-binding protein [Clostridium sp. CCUG 7971]
MNTNAKSVNKTNWLLLLLAVVLIITPLILNSGAEYGGADGEAEDLIGQINPEYEPWFNSLYEPPSGEIESLLFSTQAALGAGVIGYYLGSRRRK